MNSNWIMNCGRLFSVIIFILISAQKSLAQSPTDDDIHISAVAEFFSLHVYPHLKGHKALAVGPGGYWNDASGGPSAAAISKAAVAGCTSILRKSPYKSLAKQSCVLFD